MGAGPPPYYFYIKRPDTGAGEGEGEGEGEGGEEHSIFSQVQAPRPGKQYAVRSKPPHSDKYRRGSKAYLGHTAQSMQVRIGEGQQAEQSYRMHTCGRAVARESRIFFGESPVYR